MIFDFKSWFKRKSYLDSGLEYEEKYRHSNPPPKRPSDYMEERMQREALYSELIHNGSLDELSKIDHYAKRKAREPKTVWDKLLD